MSDDQLEVDATTNTVTAAAAVEQLTDTPLVATLFSDERATLSAPIVSVIATDRLPNEQNEHISDLEGVSSPPITGKSFQNYDDQHRLRSRALRQLRGISTL